MVPSTSRRIRNYEQVKFTATMNKAIDILRLQIEGKCPSVKFKDINPVSVGIEKWKDL